MFSIEFVYTEQKKKDKEGEMRKRAPLSLRGKRTKKKK